MAVREGGSGGGPAAARIAFVLAGGGGLSAGQAGMLRALVEAGIFPDLVIGSSAGALNGIAFASDPTTRGLDRLDDMWVSARRRTLFPLSLTRVLAAATGRGDGLASNAPLRALLERAQVPRILADTSIPAHVAVTDFATGAPVVLSDGDTITALLASSAIPGVFPPVTIDGRLYVDGGVAAETPVLQAEALGATVSYILPPAAPSAETAPHGAAPVAFRALAHLLHHSTVGDLAAARGQVHVLPAPTTTRANPLDFRDARRLVDDGYRLTRDWLAARGQGAVATAVPVAEASAA
jgi:NTE family protein